MDNRTLVTVDENIYELREVESHNKYSEEFDNIKPKEQKEKKIYIPPMSHPWKYDSYQAYLNTLKHRENNAYV